MNSTGWASEVTSESVPGVSLPAAGRLDFLPAVRSATGRQRHNSFGAGRGRRACGHPAGRDDSAAECPRAPVASSAGSATRGAHARHSACDRDSARVVTRLASGSRGAVASRHARA
jgi:hypothetical protein